MHYQCCYQCGIPLQLQELQKQRCDCCISRSPHFDETHCLERYDGVLQAALHQLKYQKRIAFAHGLTNAWNQIHISDLGQFPADYLLPVPLSAEKLLFRGFNQSWELARRIHCHNKVQKIPYALKRHHNSSRQAGNSLLVRRDAIREMFYIEHQYVGHLANKTVIVFDDVMTSGATLNEIARILKSLGVLRVINWVLLRTTKFT